LKASIAVVALAVALDVASAAELPANTWTPIGDGTFLLPEKGYPNMTGPALCWIADREMGLVAPILTESEGRDNPGYRRISVDDPVWTFVAGKAPDGLVPDMWDSPKGYVYLPGLKKVLFVKQEWWYSRKREPVAGWLLDPSDASWEPIRDPLSMSDKSADFNPAPCRDGLRLPIWGGVCYDESNREAVMFGGGGVWGRVGKEQERVGAGDWFFDEKAGRVRRITAASGDIAQARKWFPGHCGTWVFREADSKWMPIDQPLGKQPSGRILPGMSYDSKARKIVLFGGDDLARCLGDTWIYDCSTRTWASEPAATGPTARAGHAMVYVPDQDVVLLAGGYAGGWRPLNDVWTFSVSGKKWTKLAIELPSAAGHASADYDPGRKQVVLALYPATRGNRKLPVYTLRLDMAAVGRADPGPEDPLMAYHCKNDRRAPYLPGEWLAGDGAPENPEEVLARVKGLPANTWKDMNPPRKARERTWGIYIYDPRKHEGFAWGGGHSGYPGAEMSEYRLTVNRWTTMKDPTNYNPVWLHGMVGGPPGMSFGGWSLLPSHARKSYGIDPLSDSVITYAGDVYSIKDSVFAAHIGNFPIDWGGPSYQVAYVTTPHGLYGFAATPGSKGTGWLCKANVNAGVWDAVSKDGPAGHGEYDFLVYDSKRDRAMYFRHTTGEVWGYDFKGGAWAKDEPAGKAPSVIMGDGTYIPEMDAVLMVYADAPKTPEKLVFYKCGERSWYSAPSVGDPFQGSNSHKDYSPVYDPGLGIVVRITQCGFAAYVNVHVLRLDPPTLSLTVVE
jgi:hypothetical protein